MTTRGPLYVIHFSQCKLAPRKRIGLCNGNRSGVKDDSAGWPKTHAAWLERHAPASIQLKLHRQRAQFKTPKPWLAPFIDAFGVQQVFDIHSTTDAADDEMCVFWAGF